MDIKLLCQDEMIFDFDTPLEDRLECAVHADDLGDIISRLAFMYVVSSCRDIGEFLLAIAAHAHVDHQLRFEAAKAVVEHHNTFVNFVGDGYAAVDILCREPHRLLFRQSVIVYLMGSHKYKFHARKYLVTLLDPNTGTAALSDSSAHRFLKRTNSILWRRGLCTLSSEAA